MRKRTSRILFLLTFVLIIISGIVVYVLLSSTSRSSSLTNARKGYSADYTYTTSYAGLNYVNKFSIAVTGVSGDNVSFEYTQIESTNQTTSTTPTNNFSLALDPGITSTLESGSALPLFVANYLKSGSGTSEIPASGSEPALPVSYTITTGGGFTYVQFTVGSEQTKTIVNWSLEYNETTGLLQSGFASINSSLIAPSTFRYVMTSFSE